MKIANLISWILVLVGAINWGLIAIFNWNLVGIISGGIIVIATIIYCLVALAGIWLLIAPFVDRGKISIWN